MKLNRLWISLVSLMLTFTGALAQEAKYVFFFIGDGMGTGQVLTTEMYGAEMEGRIGVKPLLFSQFPHATVCTTYSDDSGVTDSAAAGTALATGSKTKNGALGVKSDLTTPVSSLAVMARNKGRRVGISTSVSIDHATPAAFYAHRAKRSSYYLIGRNLVTAGFDFYAGSDFLDPTNKKETKTESEDLYTLVQKGGITLARGYADYRQKAPNAQKMLLLQPESATDKSALPYAIDRKEGDMSLAEVTRAGIDFLTKGEDKGFFLMVEGGKIDWASHSNDAATVVHEVLDLESAIKVAYDFYLQHPDETLIVLTADHETGGMIPGKGAPLNLKALSSQKVSESGMTRIIADLRKASGNHVSWEEVQKALKECYGFGDTITLTDEQEARLKKVYEETFGNTPATLKVSEYQMDERLADEATAILNEIASVSWASGGHSASMVPVYAIGVGSERFSKVLDNTEIPKKIAEAAGYIQN